MATPLLSCGEREARPPTQEFPTVWRRSRATSSTPNRLPTGHAVQVDPRPDGVYDISVKFFTRERRGWSTSPSANRTLQTHFSHWCKKCGLP